MDPRELIDYVLSGDASRAEAWTLHALDSGTDCVLIVDEGLIPAMEIVGSRFSRMPRSRNEALEQSLRVCVTTIALAVVSCLADWTSSSQNAGT